MSQKNMYKMMPTILLIILSVNLLTNVSSKESDETTDVFVPTHKWQVVKKGQSIPKGLHVRINFETGVTEAKLLDKSENSALLEVPQDENIEEDGTGREGHEAIARLTKALKNIQPDDVSRQAKAEPIKDKFKSYAELKKELGILNITIKSDAEILHELFKKYEELNDNVPSTSKDNKVLSILENFEYLVHQIDNAREFIHLDGFNKVIYKNLNNSNVHIKSEALNILGSSVQNNPTVQIHALETGSVDKLIRMLALNSEEEVYNRAVFALSSLLRRFPIAQSQFIKNGGLSVFASFFEKPERIKVQLKIITLIYDLLVEHENAITDSNYQDKLNQYRHVELKSKLKEQGWCDICGNLFTDNLDIEKYDHDVIEKFLNIMSMINDICLPSYNIDKLKLVLIELHRHYKKLSDEEIQENLNEPDPLNHMFYFNQLKELTYDILKKFYEYKSEL